MRRDEYLKIVPDPKMRTALSGMLGREFWEIASDDIFRAMVEAGRLKEEENEISL